ncbi:hypothetical protein VSP9026_04155 [Vibrio spartinae]|uniref:Uncharacterized protein n=1 Tax=Vibrio spartinae TaxID=1918945 RepID=A0A1N6MA83_9VIBR|nr:hypothetical protein VSP9026_04155 [Vibrio spartinae]
MFSYEDDKVIFIRKTLKSWPVLVNHLYVEALGDSLYEMYCSH